MPRLVLAPSFALAFVFIYGLIAWNGVLSFSASRILPNYEFVGWAQYATLFASERRSQHPGRTDRGRPAAAHLLALHHPEPAAGVLQYAAGAGPHLDQELRSGDGADRRRPRLRDRCAGDLHVRDVVLARADRPGRGVGHRDARDRRGHRRALPLFRTAGAEMKAAFQRFAIWSVLLLFAAFFLLP